MKKASMWGLAACVFLCLAASCRRIGPLYVEIPEKKTGAESVQLHFFFDRTISMGGFAEKGDDSDYIKTMTQLWQVGDKAFSPLKTRIFDYFLDSTSEYKTEEAKNYIKREVRLPRFYEGRFIYSRIDGRGPMINHYADALNRGYREIVHQNNEQPFSGVADYIKKLYESEGNESKSAYIVVTDSYEQNRGNDNPFFQFFRDAFDKGLSGALFAVESVFNGSIWEISIVNGVDRGIRVNNGIATFFICIIGDSDTVYTYSAELAKELKARDIKSHNAVFMLKPPQETGINYGEHNMDGSARGYGKGENALNANTLKRMNMRSEGIFVISQDTSSFRNTDYSYQVLTDTGSRWAAGLALKNINQENFKYTADFSLSFSDGKIVKTGSDEPAPSLFISRGKSSIVSTRVIHVSEIIAQLIEKKMYQNPPYHLIPVLENADDCPIYLVVETDNREMDKGWHKISCVIKSEAIREPAWVGELNAVSIPALVESARAGGRVKVLEIANVYKDIAEAYNKKTESVFSYELYLLKR